MTGGQSETSDGGDIKHRVTGNGNRRTICHRAGGSEDQNASIDVSSAVVGVSAGHDPGAGILFCQFHGGSAQ